MKINIGCGRDYRPGWLNTDISHAVQADVYLDIRVETLRFNSSVGSKIQDGEADEVYISGVLEQILMTEDLIRAMNECHRVLKKGGVMTVVVPNAKYSIAHQDPMDVRKFTRETFLYFLASSRQYQLYGSVYGFAGWSNISIEENERHILTVKMIK